jgi:preprotein translocase subunit YajC
MGGQVIWLQAQGGGLLSSPLIPIALMLLIMYLLILRPQQRRQKEHEKMLESIGRGDRVVTSGGIHGVVTGAEKDVLTVEVANLKGERVRMKVDRARIDRRLEKAEGDAK